jgi:methionyl-tRNA formyltransferase
VAADADPAVSAELAPLPEHPQRLVYLGTPAVAVPPLHALHAAGFPIELVVTGVDKRRGRGKDLQPSPVKAAARDLGLTVSHDVDDVLATGADLGVVVAFGRLIRTHVLEQLPMLNLHFSSLPRWRGAAPVERAILAGDATTDVCVMQVVEELDAGGVVARSTVDIGSDETLDELRGRLVAIGSELLVDTLRAGIGPAVTQEGETTYAHKLTPDDHHLDWTTPAAELARVVRLGQAWTELRGERFKVRRARVGADAAGRDLAPGEIAGTAVGTGDGVLELVEVQPAGKGPQAAAAWARGARLEPGERFT